MSWDQSKQSSDERDLFQGAQLDTVIPIENTRDFLELFNNKSGEENMRGTNDIHSVPQRSFLFVDEVVSVYVVLRTSFKSNEQLEKFLSRLSITLEVYIVGTGRPSSLDTGPPAQQKQLISGETLTNAQKPFLVHPNSDSTGNGSNWAAFAVCESQISLAKPRVELRNPVFQVTANAALKPREVGPEETEEDDYLPSGVPTGINFLRITRDSQPATGKVPHLPTTTAFGLHRPYRRKSLERLKQSPVKDFHAASAFDAHIRLHTLNDHPTDGTLIAVLHIRVSSKGSDAVIDSIGLSCPISQIQPVIEHPKFKLPHVCKAGDEITFLYKVVPKRPLDAGIAALPELRRVEIQVLATVLVSQVCRPRIKAKWRTAADQMPYPRSDQSSMLSKPTRLLARKGDASPGDSNYTDDFGISITITGPDHVVIWENFTWEVFVFNRSTQDRTLAIIPVVNRERFDYRVHLLDLADTEPSGPRYAQLADAVIDNKRSPSAERRAALKPAELMSMSADVEAGAVAPAGCHSTKLEFMALRPGVLHLDAIRILDLGSGTYVDVRNLPDIVAVKPPPT